VNLILNKKKEMIVLKQFFFFIFEIGSSCVAQAGLELLYMDVPLHPPSISASKITDQSASLLAVTNSNINAVCGF
jgi:hypothetical protein